jgi:hypothetical protein
METFFFNGSGQRAAADEGNGVCQVNIVSHVKFRNCLFEKNYGVRSSGAIYSQLSATNNGTILFYCFFHQNTCGNPSLGSDVHFPSTPSLEVFVDCYSTTSSTPVYPSLLYSGFFYSNNHRWFD